ncbi:MAG: ferrochelatase, partial [Nitrospiraceae bacterium]|nr:ferrochelatase [Nitrospiraceae bacterium]
SLSRDSVSYAVIGIILLNLGGPDSLDAVRPFLYNLFSDRDIIRLGPAFMQKPLAALISALRSKKTESFYSLIGGRSPIAEITGAQAGMLEQALKEAGHSNIKVYMGMRYWHPFIEDTAAKMHKDGVKKVIALSLYPKYSVATTGSSVSAFKKAASNYGFQYYCAGSWCNDPLYIDALAEKIQNALQLFDEKPDILFSAHSLPQKFIDEGDPYLDETRATIAEVMKRFDLKWQLSFQSKSGPVKWLEPSTEEMIASLAERGTRNLLVVPVSFVSDHIETLYEIDMLYAGMAAGMGINMKRAESLNTSEKFIRALCSITIKNLEHMRWI